MTLKDFAAQLAERDARDSRAIHEALSPEDGGILLFRTSQLGCLTHITRWVQHWTATYADELHVSAEALCGVFGTTWASRRKGEGMLVRDPATETFGCHVCIERAERYGLPTYNLIPDTGCSATGGARFRPGPHRSRNRRDGYRDAIDTLDPFNRYSRTTLIRKYVDVIAALEDFREHT